MSKILLIEDDPSAGPSMQKVLRAEGHQVSLLTNGREGLTAALEQAFDLVITDFKLPGLNGLELIRQLHAAKPKVPLLMMTAHGTTETAIEATKLGAFEYLVKPFEVDELLDLVTTVLEQSRLMTESVSMGADGNGSSQLVGTSRAMQSIYKEIGRVANTSVPVLIRGETGTGKELIAQAIYQHSDRSNKPFIAVNCAAIPETLLESELFGHERGAFTNAHNQRIGRFEQANGGTIFLDEIGDLPPNTQSKLLRVLQEQKIQRLGGQTAIVINVRVLAATHRDLESALTANEFREDLFYRINVVTIRVPPLRERVEDIPELAHYFVRRHARDLAVESITLAPEVLAFLQSLPWSGNVRELENVIRRSLLLAKPFPVGLEHVQHAVANAQPSRQSPFHASYISELLARVQRGEEKEAHARMVADLEPELFAQAIRLAQGNQAKAARWLGITRLKMREKLQAYGLHPPSSPGGR